LKCISRLDKGFKPLVRIAQLRKSHEIIGEAARSVSEETRLLIPQVHWKAIIGMRDRLIHGYYKVDLNIVWEVLVDDLPPLIAVLETIMPPENT